MTIRMAHIFILACVFVMCGCREQITKGITEQDAVDEVLNSNGGSLEYSILWSSGEKEKDFELRLTTSPLAETLKSYPDVLTSGVATQFYSKLKNPSGCQSILVKVVFHSGDSTSRKVLAQE